MNSPPPGMSFEQGPPTDIVVVAEIELTDDQKTALLEQAQAMESERQNAMSSLARSVEDMWTKRSSNRQNKEDEWRTASRLYLGSMSSSRGNTLKTAGEEHTRARPDHNLVKSKCNITIAKIQSQQFAGGDKNWDILPSPDYKALPEHNPMAAKNMETRVYDQLCATNYGPKAREAIEDMVILGTGILKGPVPSTDKKLKYEFKQGPDGRIVSIPVYKYEPKPEMFRVDPWMFFPDDTINEIGCGEGDIEIHPMSRLQLGRLGMSEGFLKVEIDKCLKESVDEYNAEHFSDVRSLTDSGEYYLKNKYVVMEYHGPISVEDANHLGLQASYDAVDNSYYGEVWVCNGRVIRAVLEAIEGAFESPYCASTWLKDPNSPFGFGLPIEMRDPQRIATATLHMILDNASASSGPLIILNKEFMEPMDGKWEVRPHSLWNTTDSTMSDVSQAMSAITIPNVTSQLFPILNFAREIAQEEADTPSIVGGGNSPRTGTDSATGLAILEQEATVGADRHAERWDDNVTSKLIRRYYHWNLQYDPTPDIIGDFEVDVRSSTELRNKQMQVTSLEKLSVESAQNPALARWLNQDALTQMRLTMMRLPGGGVIKTPEQVQADDEAAAAQPQPPSPEEVKLEIERGRLEMENKRLELETKKLEMEMTIKAQEFQAEMQMRAEQTQARREDNQSRLMQSANERDIALLQLAQRDEESRAKIMAMLQAQNMADETNKFLKGIDINEAKQDRMLTIAEMQLKAKTGSGV